MVGRKRATQQFGGGGALLSCCMYAAITICAVRHSRGTITCTYPGCSCSAIKRDSVHLIKLFGPEERRSQEALTELQVLN